MPDKIASIKNLAPNCWKEAFNYILTIKNFLQKNKFEEVYIIAGGDLIEDILYFYEISNKTKVLFIVSNLKSFFEATCPQGKKIYFDYKNIYLKILLSCLVKKQKANLFVAKSLGIQNFLIGSFFTLSEIFECSSQNDKIIKNHAKVPRIKKTFLQTILKRKIDYKKMGPFYTDFAFKNVKKLPCTFPNREKVLNKYTYNLGSNSGSVLFDLPKISIDQFGIDIKETSLNVKKFLKKKKNVFFKAHCYWPSSNLNLFLKLPEVPKSIPSQFISPKNNPPLFFQTSGVKTWSTAINISRLLVFSSKPDKKKYFHLLKREKSQYPKTRIIMG